MKNPVIQTAKEVRTADRGAFRRGRGFLWPRFPAICPDRWRLFRFSEYFSRDHKIMKLLSLLWRHVGAQLHFIQPLLIFRIMGQPRSSAVVGLALSFVKAICERRSGGVSDPEKVSTGIRPGRPFGLSGLQLGRMSADPGRDHSCKLHAITVEEAAPDAGTGDTVWGPPSTRAGQRCIGAASFTRAWGQGMNWHNPVRFQLEAVRRVFSIQRARRSLAAPLAMASRARTTPSAR